MLESKDLAECKEELIIEQMQLWGWEVKDAKKKMEKLAETYRLWADALIIKQKKGN